MSEFPSEIPQNAAPPVTVDRRHDFRQSVVHALPSIVITILILVLWEFAVGAFNIQSFLLPAPSAILNAFAEHFDELLVSTRMAVFEAFGGLCIGTLLAVTAGLLAARW